MDGAHSRPADHGDGAPQPPPGRSFGEALRELRRQRGLSLTQLARRIHYSKGYLSKIETGSKPVNATLARLCDDALQAGGALLALLPPEERSADNVLDRRLSTAASLPAPPCPYRGLASFGTEDAHLFFGRERATAALVERLEQRVGTGPLAVVAPSGAGKSSLLRAGLVPALARNDLAVPGSDRWPVALSTPTAHPLQALLRSVRTALAADSADVPHGVSPSDGNLAAALRAWAAAPRPHTSLYGGTAGADQAPGSAGVRLVVAVDQFEEIFSLCDDEAERRAYIDTLTALAAPGPGGETAVAAVVLGVRADFTGRCLDHPPLVPVFTHGLFALGAMTAAELRECIVRPAENCGLELEPGLVELMLRDLDAARAADREAADGPAPAPGTLPLLAHALMTTWRQGTGRTMTVTGYLAAGGLKGSIAATAEAVFTGLDAVHQDAAVTMLLRLVRVGEDTEPTRRLVSTEALLARLPDPASGQAVLDAFVTARLVTINSDTVEIAHEALLRAWPRLAGWIHADRTGLVLHQQLSTAAAEWEREGRDPAALYRGTRLAAASEWAQAAGHCAELALVEEEFLTEAAEQEEQARRQVRKRARQQRNLLAVLGVLLAVAVLAGSVAFEQRYAADEQRRTALSQAMAARSAELAVGQPEASMLLAAGAYATAETPEARSALLSTQTQAFAGRLTGHSRPVNTVAFAPDGRLLASAASDGEVRLWRTYGEGPRAAAVLRGHNGPVRSVAFSPDSRFLASASSDGTVRLWTVAGHRAAGVLTGHRGPVRAVAYSPDGRLLASAGADGTVRLWDPVRRRSTAVLSGHDDEVLALSFAPDGRTLAAGGAGRAVVVWDLATQARLAELTEHSGDVLAVAFSPDGATLATAGADRTVRLWSTQRWQLTTSLAGHDDDVNGLAYGRDGHTIVSASGDGTVRRWDVASRRIIDTLAGHTDYVLAVAVAPHGEQLATAGFDHTVALWNLGASTLVAHPFSEAWNAAFSPDGKWLASAGADRSVRLWDVARRRTVAALTGHEGAVYDVAFSPDGTRLASAGADRTVRIWDVARRRVLTVLSGHEGAVFDVAFSLDGTRLASAGADRSVRVWRADGSSFREPAVLLRGHTDFVNCVVFGRDGRTVLSGSDDLTLRLWDVDGLRTRATFTGHTGSVRGCTVAGDGRTAASAANDGTVRLWDLATRRFSATLVGHSGSVRGVAFAPDGRTLASSGNDRTVRLWNPVRHRLLATLTGHTRAVWGVTFSPDGRTLASSGNDGTVRLWNPDEKRRRRAICALTGPVTPARWRHLLQGHRYAPVCDGA
ncbi:helix-turn-helix domain-containing protein [Streptomyces sp. NPDC003035]|uniref:nSTAND1 domain-containing NTPase n=1 Tax=Streptomyces sp. NPDC003035 TaxID=3364676 RepID=UPI00368294C1